eukprot:2835466-Ditylum_brightwellii.AAC.1
MTTASLAIKCIWKCEKKRRRKNSRTSSPTTNREGSKERVFQSLELLSFASNTSSQLIFEETCNLHYFSK